MEKVDIKTLTSKLNKLVFGGHFYPYHLTFWLCVSSYNLYYFIQNGYSYVDLFYGFLLGSSTWGIGEYTFHRFLLHNILYIHHKKHHIYPTKLSIIHTPMLFTIFYYVILASILKNIVNIEIFNSINIFAPLNYLSFEFTHLFSHTYTGSNYIILNAKQYHKLHHIDNRVNYNFVTPFWDWLFGTLSPKYIPSFTELLFGFIPFYSFCIHKGSVF